MEHGELSERELFDEDVLESAIQKWLTRKLRDASGGFYQAYREEEVDLEKEADIRVHAQGVEGPVCVEIKRANKYSYAEFESALSTQLVGQYLRDERASHGVLLLANLKRGRRWKPTLGESLSLVETVARLEQRAQEIVAGTPGVSGLRVIGIELTQPEGPDEPSASDDTFVVRCRRCDSTEEVSEVLLSDGSREFRCPACREV